MVVGGKNCDYAGSQMALIEARNAVEKARFNKKDITTKEKAEKYLGSFRLIDLVFGLSKDEQECYEYLKSL